MVICDTYTHFVVYFIEKTKITDKFSLLSFFARRLKNIIASKIHCFQSILCIYYFVWLADSMNRIKNNSPKVKKGEQNNLRGVNQN